MFNGREPDENRTNFDYAGRSLDSYAGRVSLNPNGEWTVSASYAYLKTPEALYWLTRSYRELSAQAFKRIERLPESDGLHRVKALIRSDDGRFADAVKEWRLHLAAHPGDRESQRAYAADLAKQRAK